MVQVLGTVSANQVRMRPQLARASSWPVFGVPCRLSTVVATRPARRPFPVARCVCSGGRPAFFRRAADGASGHHQPQGSGGHHWSASQDCPGPSGPGGRSPSTFCTWAAGAQTRAASRRPLETAPAVP